MELTIKILRVTLTLVEVVLLFNLLIIVHELGHYWAAKWRGLRVDKFQIWFGPTIWKKTIGGVQWGLGTIPAGGFVALPQMAPMEAIEGRSEQAPGGRADLPPITPKDKIIVAFAGPLFSFLLAVVFSLLVWQLGRPVSGLETTTVVGTVIEGMPAAGEGGLKPGDRILRIDGEEVDGFFGLSSGIVTRVAFSEGETILFEVERPGEPGVLEIELAPHVDRETSFFERGGIRSVGIMPAFQPVVGAVMDDSPAARAGIEEGDRFVRLNGKPVIHAGQINQWIEDNPGVAVELEVERAGERNRMVSVLPIAPERPEGRNPMLGVAWSREIALAHPRPGEQLVTAATTIFRTLGALFSSKSEINVSHLSGPVGIGGAFYDMLTSEYGWLLALWFGVVVNVNLAILNMLPLPVLDGGHITLALIEWIRGRAPNIRVLEYVQSAFVLMLLGLFLYITVLDVRDRMAPMPEPEPVVFPAAPEDR